MPCFGKNWRVSLGPDEFDRFLGHLRTIVVKEKARENLLKEFEKVYHDGLLEKGEKTLKMVKAYRDHYASLIWFENESLDGDCRLRNLIAVMKAGLSTDWIPPLLYFVERFGKGQAFDFLTRLESKFLADWILQQSPTSRISAMNGVLRTIEKAASAKEVIEKNDVFSYDREQVRQVIERTDLWQEFRKVFDASSRISPYGSLTAICRLQSH